MARLEKDNMRIYDEPITYDSFTGGINNTPSNEKMDVNELKDAINWHYNEGVLERRLGAKVLATLDNLFELEAFEGVNTSNFQSVDIYGVGDNIYMIMMVDGRLFYAQVSTDITYALDVEQQSLTVYEITIPVAEAKLSTTDGGGLYNLTGEKENEFEGLILYKIEDEIPEAHDGYVLKENNEHKLILQNKNLAEGVGINDEFYLASGTRIIKIYEEDTVLKGKVLKPKIPSGGEYSSIGLNRLSPYPLTLIKETFDASHAFISAIITDNINILATKEGITLEAILDYPPGKASNDYFFKWEFMRLNSSNVPQTDWVAINNGAARLFKTAGSKGLNKLTGVKASSFGVSTGDKVKIRCTFTEDFERVSVIDGTLQTERVLEDVYKNSNSAGGLTIIADTDYKKDPLQAFGATFVTLDIVAEIPDALPDDKFLRIHSCRKVLADGYNLIFYMDKDNTGDWYKCAVKQYDYISDKGNLNFQTNKNERLLKVVNFEGNIVAFAYNDQIGGNISVVTGAGDDVDTGDGYYSPYRRRIGHTEISTDHPNSVQVIENNLIFKFKDNFYVINSNQLDSDRIQLHCVNDKLKHFTWIKRATESFDEMTMPQMPSVYNNALFPNTPYERRLYTEVTEDYYGVIYPAQNLKWKMYFKLPIRYQDDPKTYFPWIRDVSERAFNIVGGLYIQGLSTMITSTGQVINFTDTNYKDLGTDGYPSILETKAFDLNYPKFIKFLRTLNVYYYRDFSHPFTLTMHLKNEHGVDIYGTKYVISHDYEETEDQDTTIDRINFNPRESIDQELLIPGHTPLGEAIIGEHPSYISKVFTPINMVPFLSVSARLHVADTTNVILGSLGFNFVTGGLPDTSMGNYYPNIIKL